MNIALRPVPKPSSPAPAVDWMLPAYLVNHWRRGWGTYQMTCPMCGHHWVAVAAIMTRCTSTCSACGYTEEMTWLDGSGQYFGNDGVWI